MNTAIEQLQPVTGTTPGLVPRGGVITCPLCDLAIRLPASQPTSGVDFVPPHAPCFDGHMIAKRSIEREAQKLTDYLRSHDTNAQITQDLHPHISWVRQMVKKRKEILDIFGGWRMHIKGVEIPQEIGTHEIGEAIAASGLDRIQDSCAEGIVAERRREGLDPWCLRDFLGSKTALEKMGFYFGPYHDAVWIDVKQGERVSRATLRAVKREDRDDRYDPPSFRKEHYFPRVEKFFAEMGQLWGRQGRKFDVTLSCAPTSFMRLGQWHIDSGGSSCFGFERECEHHKARLMSIPDSFVMMAYPTSDVSPLGDSPRRGEVSIRAWGRFNREAFGIANGYGEHEGTRRKLFLALGDRVALSLGQAPGYNDEKSGNGMADNEVYENGDSMFWGREMPRPNTNSTDNFNPPAEDEPDYDGDY